MSKIKVIAQRDYMPLFKRGDTLFIVAIPYEVDTIIINPLYAAVDASTNNFLCFGWPGKHRNIKLIKCSDAVTAPQGSFKKTVIELKNGSRYDTNNFKKLNDWFEKCE